MHMKCNWFQPRMMAVCLTGLFVLLAGCATQRVDWTARVGNYTYDQAIVELGPPEKSAKLTDGSVVADWLTRRGETILSPIGGGFYPYRHAWAGPVGPNLMVVNTLNYYLRLSFDPAGKLKSWKNIQQ